MSESCDLSASTCEKGDAPLLLFGMMEKPMKYLGKHLGNKDKTLLEDFRDILKMLSFDN